LVVNLRLLTGLTARKKESKSSLQHLVFPGGHPSKYWPGSKLLDFSDRTRIGDFNVIWP
jgi:hypothetical protein